MTKKTILVVEDELPLIKIIKNRLEKHNIKVTVSRTVKQAISHLETIDSIDAIWLDHYLPGKESGLDFVTRLKSPKSKWRKVPIFVVSNTASSGNVRSYTELGVKRYYVKAIHKLDEIIREIKPLIVSK